MNVDQFVPGQFQVAGLVEPLARIDGLVSADMLLIPNVHADILHLKVMPSSSSLRRFGR